jgi:hypothetical protein
LLPRTCLLPARRHLLQPSARTVCSMPRHHRALWPKISGDPWGSWPYARAQLLLLLLRQWRSVAQNRSPTSTSRGVPRRGSSLCRLAAPSQALRRRCGKQPRAQSSEHVLACPLFRGMRRGGWCQNAACCGSQVKLACQFFRCCQEDLRRHECKVGKSPSQQARCSVPEGVTWCSRRRRWRVQLQKDGQRLNRYFPTPAAATDWVPSSL